MKLGNALAVIPPGGSGQTQDEDCLFLDVIAPMKFFGGTRRKNGKKPNLAPVLVNIHGGGYWQGDKTAIYNPRGLLERADNGFVYVSMNYRVRMPLFFFRKHVNNEIPSSEHSVSYLTSKNQTPMRPHQMLVSWTKGTPLSGYRRTYISSVAMPKR